MLIKKLKYLLTILLVLMTISCSKNSQTVQTNTTTPESSPVVSPSDRTTTNTTDKIKFKLKDDSEAFSLKFKEDGAKLEAPDGKEIARFTIDDREKVKIKDPADKVLGYVITQKDAWKIENGEQTKELYILRRQSDGDYKLESGADEPIYRIKVREYGFEIETPDKQSLYKVKTKEGKITLKNAADEAVLSTKSNVIPIAVACFGFDELSQEQKAALAYAVNLSGGQ